MNDTVQIADKKHTGLISINTSHFFRGIAILMVIFSHYFEWGASQCGNEKLAHFIASLGDWGVGLFFLLSGYALYKGYGQKGTDKRYIISRLKGVYLPYIVIATLILVLSDALNDLEGLIRLITGADYWFMVILFIIYIAFYFAGKLPEKYRVFVMTVFIIDLSLWYFIKGYQNFWYTANWTFALGLVIAKHENRLGPVRDGFTLDIRDYVLCPLGKISLYIYLLHAYFYFRTVNSSMITGSGVNWYLQLLIALALTVIAAFIFEFVISRLSGMFGKKAAGNKQSEG